MASETTERELGGVGTKVLFENDNVRVWEMDLAPGESSAVHRHDHDYILVILEGDRIAAIPEPDTSGDHAEYFEAEVQTPMVVELKKGGIETAKNIGEQRYYELLIEILKQWRPALEGLRVLDLAILFSAPQIAAMLGDLGADVVKLEPPPRGGKPGGDPMRGMGAQRNGKSLTWGLVSRNKRVVTLDPTTADGRALLRRFIETADVVVENLPRRTLEQWGCTPGEMQTINPNAVVVSVSCYGTSGPYAGRDGNGSLAEAFGGLTNLTGEADGPPMLPSIALGDTLTAIVGMVGTLAACYYRDARGGTGQHVDVSMFEPVLQLLTGSFAAWEQGAPPPHRTGSRVANGVPRNVYRTRDDTWLVVSATTDNQIARLLPLLGLDSEDGLARFGKAATRVQHADELDGLVADWIATHDRDDVIEQFLDARLPVAPVNDLASVVADPQVVARGDIVVIDDPDLGPVRMVAPTPRLSATPGEIRWIGPALGAHNDEVYAEWLGLDGDAVAALRESGVI